MSGRINLYFEYDSNQGKRTGVGFRIHFRKVSIQSTN